MTLMAFHFRTPDYDDPNLDEMPQAVAAYDEKNAWDILQTKVKDFLQTVLHDTPSNIDELDDCIKKGGKLDEHGTTVKYNYQAVIDGNECTVEAWTCDNETSVIIEQQNVGMAIFESRIYA